MYIWCKEIKKWNNQNYGGQIIWGGVQNVHQGDIYGAGRVREKGKSRQRKDCGNWSKGVGKEEKTENNFKICKFSQHEFICWQVSFMQNAQNKSARLLAPADFSSRFRHCFGNSYLLYINYNRTWTRLNQITGIVSQWYNTPVTCKAFYGLIIAYSIAPQYIIVNVRLIFCVVWRACFAALGVLTACDVLMTIWQRKRLKTQIRALDGNRAAWDRTKKEAPAHEKKAGESLPKV